MPGESRPAPAAGEKDGAPSSRRRAGIATTILLAANALILTWFGVHDLFGDTSYGVRLRAALMLGVGLYIAFAAGTMGHLVHRLRRSTATGLAIVLAAGVLTAASGVLLVIYQLVGGDLTWWLLVWIAMAVGGALVVGALVQWGARIPYPRSFATAVVLTSLAGSANFGYTALYQPAAQPVQFSLDVRMDRPVVDAARGTADVPVTVSFRNTGKVGIYVVMSTYSVLGRRGRVLDADQSQEQMNLATQGSRPASRTAVVAGYDVLQTDRFIFEGTSFEPDDQVAASRFVRVRLPTTYDAIAVNAWVLVLRKDAVRIPEDVSTARSYSWNAAGGHEADAPDWAAKPGQDFALYAVPIEETSYLSTMTRRRWEGAVWRVFGDPAPGRPPGSYISFRFRRADDPVAVGFDTASRDNRLANERYGATRSETGLSERSVTELGLAGGS